MTENDEIFTDEYKRWYYAIKMRFSLTDKEISLLIDDESENKYARAGILFYFSEMSNEDKCRAVLEGLQGQYHLTTDTIAKLSGVSREVIELVKDGDFERAECEEWFKLSITMQTLTAMLN